MAKSRKEILLELLELEGRQDRTLGETPETKSDMVDVEIPSDNVSEIKKDFTKTPLTKPKKELTEKQREALKRGQEKRNANREARAEAKRQEEEMKKKEMEEKLVKKAIAVKKKQLKREEMLNEISDDEQEVKPKTPLTKQKVQDTRQAGEASMPAFGKKIEPQNIEPPRRIIYFF